MVISYLIWRGSMSRPKISCVQCTTDIKTFLWPGYTRTFLTLDLLMPTVCFVISWERIQIIDFFSKYRFFFDHLVSYSLNPGTLSLHIGTLSVHVGSPLHILNKCTKGHVIIGHVFSCNALLAAL